MMQCSEKRRMNHGFSSYGACGSITESIREEDLEEQSESDGEEASCDDAGVILLEDTDDENDEEAPPPPPVRPKRNGSVKSRVSTPKGVSKSKD